MVERPILMSTPMVQALLAGRKTQTRRAFRDQPPPGVRVGFVPGHSTTPYGVPGDRLYVCETFALESCVESDQPPPHNDGRPIKRRPADDIECAHPLWVQPHYRATDPAPELVYEQGPAGGREDEVGVRWTPSIHMPRWASRITLEITEVRVERLQSISFEDALAEGVADYRNFIASECTDGETADECARRLRWPQRQYALLWDYINGIGAWDSNPWVWAVSFRPLAPTT